MIRTVWLGLVLLIGLFGLACFKLAIGSPRPIAILQATAVAAVREMPEIRTSPVPDTLTKGDRLPVTYISTVEPLATKLQVPPGHLWLLQRPLAGIGMTRAIRGLRKAGPKSLS